MCYQCNGAPTEHVLYKYRDRFPRVRRLTDRGCTVSASSSMASETANLTACRYKRRGKHKSLSLMFMFNDIYIC
jgi:hypothetical protein